MHKIKTTLHIKFLKPTYVLKKISFSVPYHLINVLEFVLCKDISIDSVAYILPIVDCYRAAELKSMCQKFSVQNLRG